MANKRRNLGQEKFWRDAIGRQAMSGLSVREFCRRHGLSEPSFHERRRIFLGRDARQSVTKPAFVPVIISDEPTVPSSAETGIVIELRGGRALRLPGSMAVARVTELVRVLKAEEATA